MCFIVTMVAIFIKNKLKSTLSGLRQFLSTETPLKTTKNVIYFS